MRCRVFTTRYVSNTSKIDLRITEESHSKAPIDCKLPNTEWRHENLEIARGLALQFCASDLKKSQLISICERSLVGKDGTGGFQVAVYYKE